MRDSHFNLRQISTPTGDVMARVIGQGQPVLLVPGIGGGPEVFARQIEHLAPRNRLVTWELRGLSLRDTGSVPTLSDHAADAHAMLESLGALRVPVIAWSTGVPIALELLRRAPERVSSLVLISGVSGRPFPLRLLRPSLPALVPFAARALTRLPSFGTRLAKRAVQWPETMSWAKRLSVIGATFDEDVYADAVRHLADLDLSRVAVFLEQISQHDGRMLLQMIDVPTLLIAGERDAFVPPRLAQDIASRIASAEVLIVKGGTHYALVEQPEVVNLRIDKFFAEHRYPDAPPRVTW